MAGFFKKALDYLGLDDDEYQDYDPYEDQQQHAPRRSSQSAEPEPAAPAQPAMVYPRQSGVSVVSAPAGVQAQGGFTDSGVSVVTAQNQPRSASPAVRTISPVRSTRSHVTAPDSFSEAQDIGERFRSGQVVVIDLRSTDRDAAKRLVDFASGLAFGLTGEIKKIEDRVFLLRPQAVELSADEARRLRDLGLMR
jgi:cell division inhibitor SepF